MIENKQEESHIVDEQIQHQIEDSQPVQEDEQAFFLTENINQQDQPLGQPSGVNFGNEGNNADIFDEDFGKMKMEIFKQKCRNILNMDGGQQ